LALYLYAINKPQQPNADAPLPDKSWYFKAVYWYLTMPSQLWMSMAAKEPKLKEDC
jgi:hypothetical protein